MTFLFSAVPQVRARSLGANLGAACTIEMLVNFVILSGETTSRSEAVAQSKDPYLSSALKVA